MKKRFYILLILFFSLFSSCEEEAGSTLSGGVQTRALICVQLTTGGTGSSEKIHTVRFLVFDNATRQLPDVDINELKDFGLEATDANQFLVTLEVSDNTDKMLVAIVNEPATLTSTLNGITHPNQLEELPLLFSGILNDDHATLKNNGLPMTGVKWVGKKHGFPVYENANEAENNRLKMTVERAVARVDVYLQAEKEGLAKMPSTAAITLNNTYDQGYLVVGTEADTTRYQTGEKIFRNLGRMSRVEPGLLIGKSWSPASGISIPVVTAEKPKGLLVHSFYTPERIYTENDETDKLQLLIEGLKRGDDDLEAGQATLCDDEKEAIKRNHLYEVIGIIHATKEFAFKVHVVDWEEGGIEDADLDDAYTLAISRKSLRVPSRGVASAREENAGSYFTIATDYPRNWVIEEMDLTGFSDVVWHARKPGGTWEVFDPEAGMIGNAEVFIGCGENTPYDMANRGSFYVRAGSLKAKVEVEQVVSIYVGRFAGDLQYGLGADGYPEYKFKKALYVRDDDDNNGNPLRWATANGTHTFADDLWYGKQNTYDMATHTGSDDFPAARICFESNRGTVNGPAADNYVWYLPAQNQLMAVWAVYPAVVENTGVFPFLKTRYWSATQESSGSAWYADFEQGRTDYYGKANTYQVRCVREVDL